MLNIGLLGGAFDPIHAGHIHIAKLACSELKLDKVYFIPLYQAVHKDQPQLSLEERLQKITQLIKPYPQFQLNQEEINRQGKSYTIDTVKNFLKTFPKKTEINLYYIIGADAFEQFDTWKNPLELLELVNFIIVSRPGYDFSKIEKMFSQGKFKTYIDKLFFIEDEGLDISSTKIRERLYDGKNKG